MNKNKVDRNNKNVYMYVELVYVCYTGNDTQKPVCLVTCSCRIYNKPTCTAAKLMNRRNKH